MSSARFIRRSRRCFARTVSGTRPGSRPVRPKCGATSAWPTEKISRESWACWSRTSRNSSTRSKSKITRRSRNSSKPQKCGAIAGARRAGPLRRSDSLRGCARRERLRTRAGGHLQFQSSPGELGSGILRVMSLPELIEMVPLAEGETTLRGALWSEDTQVMVDCLQELGFLVNVSSDPNEICNRTITVYSLGGKVPRGGTVEQPMELFVGNAGTAARFLAALVCLGQGGYG